MAETWIPVVRPPYEVSSLGRVRHGERVLKPYFKGDYLYVSIDRKGYRINRLVAHAFHGMPLYDRSLCSCHKNDIPTDNRAENLFVWSQRENMADKVDKGRQTRGEWCRFHKLNGMRVREIRRLLALKVPQRSIAKEFRVNQSVISRINTSKAWKYS